MESTHLGWRSLAKRQWPLACALLFLLGSETLTEGTSWWQLPGTAVVCALAVLAPRRPFDAALAAATAVMATSVMLRVADAPPSPAVLVAGVAPSEGAAVMALIALLVRQASVVRVLVGVAALTAAAAVTQPIRPSYWERNYAELDYDGPTFWQQVLAGGVLLALSVGTGLYFRARDRERSTLLRAEVAAAQHAERMALARELHDVVAHYVTGIVVHAQAAQAVPGAAAEVLPVIVRSGNEALTAMRRLVGTLRGSETGTPTATSDLADDVRQVVAQSGQPVRLSLDLPSEVPPSLARSVLRLVQESLTNTRKHAEGVTAVDVTVAVAGGSVAGDASAGGVSAGDVVAGGVVHVVVADDGRAPRTAPVGGSGGFGLVGMRERVELLGGTFSAGPRTTGGWEVRAELPIAG